MVYIPKCWIRRRCSTAGLYRRMRRPSPRGDQTMASVLLNTGQGFRKMTSYGDILETFLSL